MTSIRLLGVLESARSAASRRCTGSVDVAAMRDREHRPEHLVTWGARIRPVGSRVPAAYASSGPSRRAGAGPRAEAGAATRTVRTWAPGTLVIITAWPVFRDLISLGCTTNCSTARRVPRLVS